MPVSRYETVGFHESGHDGAFQLEVVNLDDWSTCSRAGGRALEPLPTLSLVSTSR